jgi:cytochrome P450
MHKVTFWIFAYLCHSPRPLETFREETTPGVVDDVPNVSYLTEKCPRLEAIFLEVLRLVMASSLMRHVTELMMIGGKVLEEGNNVMVLYRQLHFSGDVWGDDVSNFNPDRFLTQKEMVRSSSYRPFDGGQYLCPGRFMARHSVLAFVALTLSRYDIRLDQ